MAIKLKKSIKKFSTDKNYLVVVEYGYDPDDDPNWDGDSRVYEVADKDAAIEKFKKLSADHDRYKKQGGHVYPHFRMLGVFKSKSDAERSASEFLEDLSKRNR